MHMPAHRLKVPVGTVCTAVYLAILFLLTLSPPDWFPANSMPKGADKGVHFLLYAGLTWLFITCTQSRPSFRLAVGLIAIAIVNEGIQGLFGRQPCVFDLAANLLGIICVMIVFHVSNKSQEI